MPELAGESARRSLRHNHPLDAVDVEAEFSQVVLASGTVSDDRLGNGRVEQPGIAYGLPLGGGKGVCHACTLARERVTPVHVTSDGSSVIRSVRGRSNGVSPQHGVTWAPSGGQR